ncbi:MAG TPA: ABC transporter ATP-binding protein [Nitrososphaeraceae archaeon]|nr:ABC transporter ATP-binding protein [Nitrososphaeraceae archaeon]
MTGQQHCISVYELMKYYNNDIRAINGISFNVEYGKVFGFLGPNGAGKTTTIKILTTLIRPSSGKVHIFGKDVVKHSSEVRKRIGVVLQQPSFEANLTVERALNLYGFLWGLAAKRRKDKLREILHAFDLESLRNTKNDELSIGQRRRVQVAREFMHDMDLLFLDEPTVGLDPSARRMLLDYIKRQVKAGLTVFFTTHIMEEAEYLCDEIAIINRGKILAFDTPAGLKQKYGGTKAMEIKLKDIAARSVLHLVNKVASNSDIDIPETNTISIGSVNAQEMAVKIIELLSENDVQIESISITPPSLEDVFLAIVNHGNKHI